MQHILCCCCCQHVALHFVAGRAAYENAKDATVDTGRYIAGRVGAVANGDSRDTGKHSQAVALLIDYLAAVPALPATCALLLELVLVAESACKARPSHKCLGWQRRHS